MFGLFRNLLGSRVCVRKLLRYVQTPPREQVWKQRFPGVFPNSLGGRFYMHIWIRYTQTFPPEQVWKSMHVGAVSKLARRVFLHARIDTLRANATPWQVRKSMFWGLFPNLLRGGVLLHAHIATLHANATTRASLEINVLLGCFQTC